MKSTVIKILVLIFFISLTADCYAQKFPVCDDEDCLGGGGGSKYIFGILFLLALTAIYPRFVPILAFYTTLYIVIPLYLMGQLSPAFKDGGLHPGLTLLLIPLYWWVVTRILKMLKIWND